MENINKHKSIYHKLYSIPENASYIQNEFQILPRNNIKLLTYNFFLRPPPIRTNKDDYKSERLNDLIERLDNYDIICFQEMFTSFHDRRQKIIKHAAERGFFYYLSSPSPHFFSKFVIDGGLLLLSRFPIEDCRKISFDYGVMSDSLAMKGALYAKIKIQDNYLCLFTTHLQASYFDSGEKLWNFTVSTRTQQSETLINFIYDTIYNIPIKERENCIFVLCGDFNINAYNYEEMVKKYNISQLPISEYDEFIRKLSKIGNVIDLIKNKYNKHLFTYGCNEDEFDKVLTDKEDINSHQALDYIFEIEPDFSSTLFNLKIIEGEEDNRNMENMEKLLSKNYEKNSLLKIDYDSVKVEYFLIKDRPYQQLSDHFGLSMEIKYDSI